jgi:hypothetical protein
VDIACRAVEDVHRAVEVARSQVEVAHRAVEAARAAEEAARVAAAAARIAEEAVRAEEARAAADDRQRARDSRNKELECGRGFRTMLAVRPCKPGSNPTLTVDGYDAYIGDNKSTFDHIFTAGFKISDVHDYFTTCVPIQRLKTGQSLVLLAYGYSGAGKTRLITRGDKVTGESALMCSLPLFYQQQMGSECGSDAR